MAGLQIFYNSSWRATGVEDSYWDVLTATPASQTVNLSWSSAGGSPTSYELSVNNVVQNVGNVTSFSPTGLSFGVSYEFKVRPVFSDGSKGGWSFFKSSSPSGFNEASGGIETTVTNYNGTGQTWKVHKFTSSGTFTVTGAPEVFSVLWVAGGGAGGSDYGGGGGAGGMLSSTSQTLTVQNYTVTVGTGGPRGSNGGNSSAFGTTAIGGGRGGNYKGAGIGGGSGGGGGADNYNGGAGTPGGAGTSGQGNNGGNSWRADSNGAPGGGGGKGAAGAQGGNAAGGAGGIGLQNNITGTNTYYAGGGGAVGNSSSGAGGAGGGANANVAATGNLGGGGGGGAGGANTGKAGGDGVVIIAYKIA
jgi:hypothetical protein